MKIIPVLTDHSKQFFSEHGIDTLVRQGFTSFHTKHLKPGVRFDLLGISQTESLLETGILDSTDAIDPNVSLKGVLLRIMKDTGLAYFYYHEVEQLPLTMFTALAGTYRSIGLNFMTKLRLSVDALPVAFTIHAVGSVNLELGDTEAHFSVKQETESGHQIEVVGYDLNAFRVNYNRRPAEEMRMHPHDKA